MQALVFQLQEKEPLRQRLQEIIDAVKRYTDLIGKQRYLLNDIEPLEQIYPPTRITALLQDQEQAQQRDRDLLGLLQKLNADTKLQEEQIGSLVDRKQATEQEKIELERQVAVTEVHLQNAQRVIKETQALLPAEWLTESAHLSESSLSGWQQEIEELQGATEQRQALERARQDYEKDQQRLQSLKTEFDQIPVEARQAPELLQKEFKQAEISYRTFEQQEKEVSAELLRLGTIQAKRKDLEPQWVEAARLASRYKDLTDLLGLDGLQHYLVQKAEIGIVYHANEILDRISGGTLRLELRSNRKKKAGALDLVVYNAATSASKAQSLKQLSGSQQFRVAVSLALGIGRYAGNENHRVESVIIDEGFGSLDEKGRREMIQAIHELGDELKCIIVVSHQREFFDEFDNKYLVELVDGSTRISLL